MTVATLLLREPGPAQSNMIYHFCGRPPGTSTSSRLDAGIAAMLPQQRLANILWEGKLRGSVPFGAVSRMVCFSESPAEHLHWLLNDRAFPPWALIFDRQRVYSAGGGPVWYTRDAQYQALTSQQRDWAVRFDAFTSDWLHEREWRIPLPSGYDSLHLDADALKIVIIGEPDWKPWLPVLEPTGRLVNTPSGVVAEMAPQMRLPLLWDQIHAFWWDSASRRFAHVHAPTQA